MVLMLMGLMFAYIEFNILRMVRRSPHRAGTRLLTMPVTCPQCGIPGLPGAQCLQCGSNLPQVNDPKQGFVRQCRACGKQCVPGARFCTYCGATFDVPRVTQDGWQAQRDGANQQPHFVRITPTGQEEIVFVINTTQVRVGKTLDNEFVLDHDSVSKHHAAVIWHKSGYYYIADLKSTNGTYVNGKRVSEQWLLDGCEVRLGDVNLVYRGPRFQIFNPAPDNQ